MFLRSKLHNNSILTGSVDSYCLVCDNYLRTEDEAYTHTDKPIHKKNWGAATRLEKYKNDHIIKVKKGYYCSYCNILLTTTTKVGLHVNDTKHQDKKGAQILDKVGDNIVAFNEVAISRNAWHGIVDNTCLICNTEFDKEDEHRTNQSHILKLIQSKCEFGDKYVYRQVDADSFYCLICWNVFSIVNKPGHHEDIKHKTLYNTGIELKNKTSPIPEIKTGATSENPIQSNNVNVSKINDLTEITENHTINAVSAKNTKAAPKSTDAAPKKVNGNASASHSADGKNTKNTATAETVDAKKINAMDTSISVDAKKINAMGSAKSVDAKKTNAMDTATSVDAKNISAMDTVTSADPKITNAMDTATSVDAKNIGAMDTATSVDAKNISMDTATSVDAQNIIAMDTAESVDAKEIDAMETATAVDAKEINAKGTTKSAVAKKFAADSTKKMKAFVKEKDPVNKPVSKTPKTEDFIDVASKVLDPNYDLRMREYLDVNNYIVHEEANLKRCVICDLINIRSEDVEAHISNDLHHQIMLQKHRETLLKKEGPQANINVTFQSSNGNIVKDGRKIYLRNPDNPNQNAMETERNGKPHQELKLELFPPLDVLSKIKRQNPDGDISSDEDDDKSKILDNVDKYQYNDIKIDFTSETVRCKRCAEDLPFDFETLEEHVRYRHGQKDYRTLNREIILEDKLRSFAGDNYMVLLENEVYCKLCSCGLPLNLAVLTGHANLASHRAKVARYDVSPEDKTQSSALINVIYRVECRLESDIIVNNSHLLPYLSFHFVRQEGKDYICALCEVQFPKDSRKELPEHINLFEHKKKLGLCNVVTCLPREFIREVTPGEYHCGCCNIVAKSWTAMVEHLATCQHCDARNVSQWNLERCIIAIRSYRPQQHTRRGNSEFVQPDYIWSPLLEWRTVHEWLPILEQPRADRPPPVPERPAATLLPISFQYFSMLQTMETITALDDLLSLPPE